jgi:hypothetical protein
MSGNLGYLSSSSVLLLFKLVKSGFMAGLIILLFLIYGGNFIFLKILLILYQQRKIKLNQILVIFSSMNF